MKIFLMCCPKCGNIKAGQDGCISLCELCGTQQAVAYEIGDKQDMFRFRIENKAPDIYPMIREQYCKTAANSIKNLGIEE
ncbi:MAG: hypothetical protein RRZ24_05675 [Clostridia bacterium]